MPVEAPIRIGLWFAAPSELDAADLRWAESVLDAQETVRADSFLSTEQRKVYVVAHGLLRRVLSSVCTPVSPEAWKFEHDEHGRPHIALPQHNTLDFNLSHAKGLVACSISTHGRVGVDVEDCERKTDVRRIARRFFHPEEYEAMAGLSVVAQRQRFFTLWTIKEAVAKADGRGVAITLNRFSVHFDDAAMPHIRWKHDEAGQQDWQITTLQPTRRHAAALAIRGDQVASYELTTYWAKSLRDGVFETGRSQSAYKE